MKKHSVNDKNEERASVILRTISVENKDLFEKSFKELIYLGECHIKIPNQSKMKSKKLERDYVVQKILELHSILIDKETLENHREFGSGKIFTNKPKGYIEMLDNFDIDKWIFENI